MSLDQLSLGLLLFQIVILRQDVADAGMLTAGLLAVILGLMLFMGGPQMIPFVFFPDSDRHTVTHAAPEGTRLKAYKGINLPKTRLGIFGLTEKDREDLRFVVRHADGVNVSFVNHPDDVEDLIDELEAHGGEHLGVVLKIETAMGVRHLPGILLAAMEWSLLGVMIARGDLAAEVGWKRLARAQEETFWVCEAAHVPVIWATEVLARLAKKGLPTRN